MAPLTTSNHDLASIAWHLGIDLTHHTHGPLGWYSPTAQTISTRTGLTIADYRSTLAHELGHAVYRDEHTGHGYFDQKQERRADRFAAHLLIDPDELESWCRFYGPSNIPAIAHELEVTLHLLISHLTRRKRTTP